MPDVVQSPGKSSARVKSTVFQNYVLSHLGYFFLLPILPLLLEQIAEEAAPWFIGAALFTLTSTARGASLFCGGLLHSLSLRGAILAGLIISAAGFALLAVAPGPAGALVCLAVAGLGISVNSLMMRAYITMELASTGTRHAAFSVIQIAVNISATLGPLTANLFFSDADHELCLLVVAALYLVAAATAVTVPPNRRPTDTGARTPTISGVFRSIIADSDMRRVAAVSLVGWFLYGQLFSALTLHINQLTSSPLVLAGFFITNAVLIATAQLPVSAYAAHKLDSGTLPVNFLRFGVVAFAAAFAILAGSGGEIVGAFAGIVVFSIAETLFTPIVSTAFSELSGDRPIVEQFNSMQLVTALGESLGTFAGGMLFLSASTHGLQPLYWLSMSVLAVLAAACSRHRTSARHRRA